MTVNLKALAYEVREGALDIIYSGKTGHIGGDFSEAEILTVLYFHVMNISPENADSPDRDYFILSKGHSMESYYTILAKKGFLDLQDVIERYSRLGSPYIGHPNNKLPGIEMNSGSLGHGLPVCVGIAKGLKMDGRTNRVYTLMGDGELAEGSVWEGFMSGAHYGLDNLTAVIDRNGLQISGSTEDVMHHEDLGKRIEAFGWHVIRTAGNDVDALIKAFDEAKEVKGVPTAIIADTTKGKGASFIENIAGWHHRVPTEEEYLKIKKELAEKKEALL